MENFFRKVLIRRSKSPKGPRHIILAITTFTYTILAKPHICLLILLMS